MANTCQPPILVGEKIFWLGSGSGLPKPGIVKWIGHLTELGQSDWTVGIELDEPLPLGGIDGEWGQRKLFKCKTKHGLIVPITQITSASCLKLSKYYSDSSKHLKGNYYDLNQNSVVIKKLKPYENKGSQIVEFTDGSSWNGNGGTVVSPIIRNDHDIVSNVRNCHDERKTTNEIQPNNKRNQLRNGENGLNSTLFNGIHVENSNIINKLDTIEADEEVNLIFNKCIELKGSVKDVLQIVNNGNGFQTKRMLRNHLQSSNNNNNIIQTNNKLEGVTISDTVIASRRQIFFKHGRSHSDELSSGVINSSQSSSSSRKEKTASGLFSFFKWFKKDKDDSDTEDDSRLPPSVPSSPKFIRSQSSSCGSVDTLFSTATASSFAFIHPTYYRPFGSASQAETRISEGPETYTYKKRIKERNRRRELEKDVTLKKKYNLFSSNTLYRSVDDITGRYSKINKCDESLKPFKKDPESRNSTLNRKKRKAPPPPAILANKENDYSLPTTLEHLNKSNDNSTNKNKESKDKQHRRTASESAKDKKAGAYCHVQGKRKAPQPPINSTNVHNTDDKNKQSNQSLGKKKRPAPKPPVTDIKENTETENCNRTTLEYFPSTSNFKNQADREKKNSRGSLSPEEKERLLKNIAKLQAVANKRNSICTPPSSPRLHKNMDFSLSNDSLKLERGVLKSTKSEEGTSSTKSENKLVPLSPVSPRPWYKRHIINGSGKLIEKKKEKDKLEDWMLEVGIPRRMSLIKTDNDSKFNIFNKIEKTEEKRKSQISMLVNISELDREAAEIVQKEREKEQAILAAEDAKYYSDENIPEIVMANDFELVNAENIQVQQTKKNSARDLISLFNAITNVTKVTVNTSIFSKEGSSLFSREGKEKRLSFGSSSFNKIDNTNDIVQEKYNIISEDITVTDDSNIKKESITVQTQQTNLEFPIETRTKWNKLVISNNEQFIDNTGDSSESEGAVGSRVTIEEIDEFDVDIERSMKTQALYEANKLRKHQSPSPSIPTIIELSETTSSSVATSPGSTSTRSQTTISPITPTTCLLKSIAEIKPPETTPMPKLIQNIRRPSSIWSCPQCTLENPRWRLTCEACDMVKPPILNPYNKKLNNLNEKTEEKGSSSDQKNEITQKENETKHTQSSKEQEVTKTNLNDTQEKGNTNSNGNVNKLEINEENVDEVRKARLAFFHKTLSNNSIEKENISDNIEADKIKNDEEINLNKYDDKIKNMEEEHEKLKEMLKDLKHSLPKRHKNSNQLNKYAILSDDKNDVTDKEELAPMVKNLGAIKKVPLNKIIEKKTDIRNNDTTNKTCEKKTEEKAQIYLMKTEKIIEEIRVKKTSSNDGFKPGKVSASVQTSAMVRKADTLSNELKVNEMPLVEKPPLAKTPSFNEKHINLPITVEEYSIKDGILYTSLSKEKKKIGTGTFELILAQDFAGIKATKTGNGHIKNHIYANVQSSGEDADISSSSNSGYSHINNSILNKTTFVNGMRPNECDVEKLSVQLTQPKGLADFKADLESEASSIGNNDNSNIGPIMMNTVAVNRLLRRLETAISKGQLKLAAKLAKELAQLKINCSVTRQKAVEDIVVDMYIEDKQSHQGPIPLMVSLYYTVAQLKKKIEKEFEIPVPVQRWILGKHLAIDDSITLMDLGINTPHCPIFLYLVAPDMGQERTSTAVMIEDNNLPGPSTSAPHPPPPPENLKQGGWYYNDEEDKYSFCGDSESDVSELSRVPTPLSIIDNEEVLSDYIDELNIGERPPTPPERQIDVEQAGAVNIPVSPTGTLALGWKCELCTLVNCPTRPGCAACTHPRPSNYKVPKGYQIGEHEQERIKQEEKLQQETAAERLLNYQALVDLENADVVLNAEEFECPICFIQCLPRDGVMLRDCLHSFCRACLINTVQFNEEAEVKCPYRDDKYACDSALLEREIKALVPPNVYEQHLAKSVAVAENKIGNAFHCKTPDCPGWCIFEDNVNEFPCPVCKHTNCLTCQAIHMGINCKQFQERAKEDSETNADARRTNEMLEEMVQRGEAMKCPTCQVILMKKWGCDWLRCSMCKTEICWVTRGPRWGPQGRGDTNGGCKCGVNGVKCHPKCNYCH